VEEVYEISRKEIDETDFGTEEGIEILRREEFQRIGRIGKV
jgi:hypothetical protein